LFLPPHHEQYFWYHLLLHLLPGTGSTCSAAELCELRYARLQIVWHHWDQDCAGLSGGTKSWLYIQCIFLTKHCIKYLVIQSVNCSIEQQLSLNYLIKHYKIMYYIILKSDFVYLPCCTTIYHLMKPILDIVQFSWCCRNSFFFFFWSSVTGICQFLLQTIRILLYIM
jgi:hypothetical protein